MAGFRKAAPMQAFLKLAAYGPPGSGKTFSSLLIAEGLAKAMGKRVAYVDTERGTDFYAKSVPAREVHPDAFDFDCLYTRSVTELLKAVRELDTNVYGVLVLDSITHIWEACKLAYNGHTTRAGTIPFNAWQQIKKPYRDLLSMLLNMPVHVVICGRQGVEYGEDEKTGELKVSGKKMKAEGETAYEPHVLMRMEGTKDDKGKTLIAAWVEKDRTGVLAGKTIPFPDFDRVARPLLGLLGLEQAQTESDETTAAKDAEALARMEKEKADLSRQLLEDFAARFQLAKTPADVEKVSKAVTPDLKKQMLTADVAALREKYLEASRRANAEASAPEAPPSQAVPAPTDGGNGHALPHSGGPLDRLDNEQYARLQALAKAKGGLDKWLPRLGSKSLAALPPGLYEHALMFLELDDLSVKDFLDYYQLQGLSQLPEERRGHALGLLRRGVGEGVARA